MIEITREETIKELNTFKIGAKSELGKNALDMAIISMERVEELEEENEKLKNLIAEQNELSNNNYEYIAQLENTVTRLMKIQSKYEHLKEGITNAKTEIEDTGAYEQETKDKTEFLRGIDYCLVKLKVELGEIEKESD